MISLFHLIKIYLLRSISKYFLPLAITALILNVQQLALQLQTWAKFNFDFILVMLTLTLLGEQLQEKIIFHPISWIID
jgi:steroid 5-alpha reductase family enzyme